MAFRGDISALILGALDPEPLHGYQIVRRLKESGVAGKMSEGQVYPYLHKMEREDLVAADWDTETGGAPRRVYRLTPKGVLELKRQRSDWKEFTEGVSRILNVRVEVAGEGNA